MDNIKFKSLCVRKTLTTILTTQSSLSAHREVKGTCSGIARPFFTVQRTLHTQTFISSELNVTEPNLHFRSYAIRIGTSSGRWCYGRQRVYAWGRHSTQASLSHHGLILTHHHSCCWKIQGFKKDIHTHGYAILFNIFMKKQSTFY